jgi:hypothetical protein
MAPDIALHQGVVVVRNLAFIIISTLAFLAGNATTEPVAVASPPPPLAFTLVWHDNGEATDDDKRLRGNKTSMRYFVLGNQVTRTVHYDAHDDGIVPEVETRTATLADPEAIANLAPSYSKTTTLTLPRRPKGQERGNSIDVSLQFDGDAKVLSISGEMPKKPKGELAQLIALRRALDNAFAKAAAPAR